MKMRLLRQCSSFHTGSRPGRLAALGEVGRQIAVDVGDRRADDPRSRALKRSSSGRTWASAKSAKPLSYCGGLLPVDRAHNCGRAPRRGRSRRGRCPARPPSTIARIASWASRIIGVSSISAPELASVSSILFDSISRWRQALLRLDQLPAIVARVAGEVGEARLDAVDAGLDQAGRMGDALGLAVDHRHDLGHFGDGVADLAEARPGRRGCARRRS